MRILFILIYLLISTPLLGQLSLTPQQKLSLDSIIALDVPENAPGVATALIADGDVIYQKYSGYENLKKETRIDAHSRFNVASNAKQFTALAILVLEEQGKLKLADDIRTYLPELYQALKTPIYIVHLIQHTSGIRDVYDLWSLQGITWWKQTYDNQDVLDLLANQQGLNFSPGVQYAYSNSNYILLAEIIARVSGTSFIEFTNQLFTDLNMPNTSFENDFTRIKNPVARAYFNFDTWSTYDWKWNAVGDGNLFSTLADQIEWEKTVQGYGHPAVSRELIKKSQQLHAANENLKYGYGLEFDTYRGKPYRFHEGSTGAWKATVVRFENPKLAVVTLTNSGKVIPAMMTRQFVDVVLKLENEATDFQTAPEHTGNYVSVAEVLGRYLTPGNYVYEFLEGDSGNLILNRLDRGAVVLERESANVFHQKYDPAFKQEFTKTETGEMEVTAYYTTHAPYSLTRPEADWENYDYKKLDGTYVNSETGVKLELEYVTDQTYLVYRDGKKSQGFLVTLGKLLVGNYAVTFTEEQKEVGTIYLSADRIQMVKFDRQD
ncbi:MULTISPECIES: serine hydrolase [unclassified Leeuwenhoekiella]|uniref:serine hydrolase domain-containing protein n=1 Tax=unclassified Leeuwenhoekiella TaxID=2615029 RepID=UPI0025C0F7A0|nr:MULTISPECIES: serine hydrolase domain-containing protein [unclassified Leeuwenhoekiella]